MSSPKPQLPANCLFSAQMPMVAKSTNHRGTAENYSFLPLTKRLDGHAPASDYNTHISSKLVLLGTKSSLLSDSTDTTLDVRYFTQIIFHSLHKLFLDEKFRRLSTGSRPQSR